MASGMSIRAVWAVVPVCVVMALVASSGARAYTAEISPWDNCTLAARASLAALEHNLSPADGATVQAGTPVTFSGESGSPLTFAVASSAALLSSPDIDGGPGTAQAGSSLYTFTSAKAAAAARTVYWSASFSDASLPECAGQSPSTYTTTPRTLTVVPNAAAEREAREAKERETAATQAAEGRAAEQAAASRQCVVPKLKGDTLRKARRALDRAHCRLGAVSKPRGRGRLVVAGQAPRAGKRLAAGARVRVVLSRRARR